jgi:putative ABC transport system permease protein
VNTAVFSVVRRVLIAPLPYRVPEQLVRLYTVPATADADYDKLSAAELAQLASDSKSLSALTAFGNYGSFTYDDGRIAEAWQTAAVAPNFLDVLGVTPLRGRGISMDDVARGAPPVAVISYSLWQRTFAGDTAVIGRTVQLNARGYTIVGIMPPDFVSPTFTADAWLPLNLPGLMRATGPFSHAPIWRAVARVRDGVSAAALASDLALVRARTQALYPDIKLGVVRPVVLRDAMVGRARTVLLVVMAAALLVLLVTCVNVAGLFLSRAAARQRELGVRVALGASRSRLLRQLLTESVVYGIAGGGAGIALAFFTRNALIQEAAASLPPMGDIRIDMVVLAFAAALSIGSGIAFGVLPAFAATHVDVSASLGGGTARGASQGHARVRGGRVLVAAQMALAVMLMVGAGLLLRTFVGLVRTNVGYSADSHTLTFGFTLPSARYPDADARAAVARSLLARIRALPGVEHAGYTAVAPWQGGMMSVPFRIEGRPTDATAVPRIEFASITDDWLESVRVPVIQGRGVSADDRAGTAPVALVSASVARRFWPNASPIGAHIRIDTRNHADSSAEVREIVGVVGDVRPRFTEDIVPTVYVPEWQDFRGGGSFALSTRGDALALLPAVRAGVHDVDPLVAVGYPRTLRDVLRGSIAQQQLAMTLMVVFAALALALSALGVYSVMAYTVTSRAREFGIRLALGARRGAVLGLVLRQGMATALVGIACGLGVATVASGAIEKLLVGVSTHDATTFLAAPLLVLIVAIGACVIPARAATHVQPVDALRSD